MATLLYRIGRFSYRRAWLVILGWVLVLGAILGGGLALGGQTSEDFTIPGTESQQTLDKLNSVFPSASGASAQVVFVAPEGTTVDDAANKKAIDDTTDAIGKLDQVDTVVSPFSQYAANAVSGDKSTAYATVQFDGPAVDITPATIADLEKTGGPAKADGLRVEFGGAVFQDNSFGLTPTEGLGVLFAGVVLFIAFGSLLAAGMPLLSALIGVGISVGAVTLAASFATVSSTAPLLAVMIGLAVGIDYALFILSRHRNQLAQGMEPEESAAQAVATAGSAVLFAGITVIIALLGLLVVGIPFLSVMGVASAFAVLVAVAIAVTLLPAIMGLAKRRLAPKEKSRAYKRAIAAANHDESGKKTLGARWVGIVMKAPVVFIVAIVGLLGVASIPALSLDLNLPTSGQQPLDSTNRQAYDLIAKGFGPGYNGPLIVAADITQTTDIQTDLKAIAADLREVKGVTFVGEGLPDATLDTAIFQVIPDAAPDSPETKTVVQALRDLEPTINDRYHTPIAVTGQTAAAIDVSNLLTGALLPFGVLVVGLSIVLLAMVFRSIAVPIKAALGFLLSVGTSFGVVVAVFQWGWLGDLLNIDTTGPIISFLPILLMAILFGLAMDYEVFLVSGMREEFVKTGDSRRAVRVGFQNGARVVTSAALIMFFVFFAFVPEGTGAIKMIALALAVGVFVDAFLVRMTLVPAIMTLLGARAWWIPGWLARILPNVDVEGEGLRDHIEAREWAAECESDAVTASRLQVAGIEHPLSFGIPAGAVAFVSGDTARRRMLGATLAGRVAPESGMLQVLGRSLPSEAHSVSCAVTLIDVSSARPDGDTTVGEAFAERLSLARPWYRPWVSARTVAEKVDGLRGALLELGDDEGRLHSSTTLGSLSPVGAALVLVALGAADGARLAVIDTGDTPLPVSAASFAAASATLLPTSATLVLGCPEHAVLDTPKVGDRPAFAIDLSGDPSRSALSEGASR